MAPGRFDAVSLAQRCSSILAVYRRWLLPGGGDGIRQPARGPSGRRRAARRVKARSGGWRLVWRLWRRSYRGLARAGAAAAGGLAKSLASMALHR